MKTKLIKVSTADRLPEEKDDYLTEIGKAIFFPATKLWFIDKLRISPKWWLLEVPDYEEEILELMKKLDSELDYQDRCREMTGDLYDCWDELKTLLTKLKTKES